MQFWLTLFLFGRISSNSLPEYKNGGNHHHHHEHHHPHSVNHLHGDTTVSTYKDSEHVQHVTDLRSGKSLSKLIDFSEAVDDTASGLKCLIEEMSVDTLKKESLLTCTHSLINVCHYTYITQFKHTREEKCDL